MLRIYVDANQRKINTVILQDVEGDVVKELDKKHGDIDMVASIAQILKENGLKINQIDEFSYTQDGQSFTGVKSSAAVANILSWAVKGIPYQKLPMPKYHAEPNITPRDKI